MIESMKTVLRSLGATRHQAEVLHLRTIPQMPLWVRRRLKWIKRHSAAISAAPWNKSQHEYSPDTTYIGSRRVTEMKD